MDCVFIVLHPNGMYANANFHIQMFNLVPKFHADFVA